MGIRNENDEVIRYTAQLVAQGFSQRPDIDYNETCSPVTCAIMFRFLIGLAVSENLYMRFMNVVTTYLYDSPNTDIYTKIPEGFKMPKSGQSSHRSLYSIKV